MINWESLQVKRTHSKEARYSLAVLVGPKFFYEVKAFANKKGISVSTVIRAALTEVMETDKKMSAPPFWK